MIELTQTSLYPNGNCWQTAVACILEVDPEVMPPQAEYDKFEMLPDGGRKRLTESYNNVLQVYLKKHHGLAYCELHIPAEAYQCGVFFARGYHLMTGTTVRSAAYNGERHVVVGLDGKMVWDPHPSHVGLLDEIHWAFLIPWPKAWSRQWEEEKCVCPRCKAE